MEIEVYLLNSFAIVSGGGNPAAVVLDADHLSVDMMQETAGKIGLSETAFVMSSDKADIKIRFFTPLSEVNLCGHATIAVFSLLRELNAIGTGHHTFEASGDVLSVLVSEDEVLMDMQKAEFFDLISVEEIADSLNISKRDIRISPPPQVVSTGLKDLIIPISDRVTLETLVPDMDKVAALSGKYGIEGYHLYVPGEEITAYTRNFAPLLGIPEESATGTASGALAAFMYTNSLLADGKDKSLMFMQGETMGRPSQIRVLITGTHGVLEKIQVGGGVMDMTRRLIQIDGQTV